MCKIVTSKKSLISDLDAILCVINVAAIVVVLLRHWQRRIPELGAAEVDGGVALEAFDGRTAGDGEGRGVNVIKLFDSSLTKILKCLSLQPFHAWGQCYKTFGVNFL